MTDKSHFVESVESILSFDAQTAELRFKRRNGETASVEFDCAAAPSIMMIIEQQLGQLFEKQRVVLHGQDPRIVFPIAIKQVAKIQGAVSQGRPVISFVLNTGLRLDLGFDQTQIHDLKEWLQELEDQSHQSAKPPN